MRMQINKLGLELVDFTNGITDFGVRSREAQTYYYMYPSVWEKSDDFSVMAYVCPDCGCELFAKWVWYEVSISPSSDRRYGSVDPTIQSQFQSVISKLNAAEKKYIEHIESIKKEMSSIGSLKKCPICGNALSREAGYYIKNKTWSKDLINDTFSMMYTERQSTDKKAASFQVEQITARYEAAAALISVQLGAHTIKTNSEHLKDYLHKLIKTEKNIYALAQRLETLYYSRFEINRSAYQSQMSLSDSAKNKVDNAKKYYKQCIAELNSIKQQKPQAVNLPRPTEPVKPSPPTLETPGFFNKKKVLASNASRTEIYKEQCEQYEADMAVYKQKLIDLDAEEKRQMQVNKERMTVAIRLAQENVDAAKHALDQAQAKYEQVKLSATELPTPAKASKTLLDNEIQIAEKCYKELLECRASLYSYDVVFGKYRNMVALSTFYEYLMSGRCDVLEGVNGAYNLYESEIRSNLIISQLSQVLVSLDQIQNSQYVICSELRNINTSLTRLESTMDRATKSIEGIQANTQNMEKYMERIYHNSDVIAHNTAVSAYYSKVNAELTDALGYMVAFS